MLRGLYFLEDASFGELYTLGILFLPSPGASRTLKIPSVATGVGGGLFREFRLDILI